MMNDTPRLIFEILTIFPDMFKGVLDESIVKRAVRNGLVGINPVNIWDFTEDKHGSVDDYLYGGEPGMLMKCEPLSKAIRNAQGRNSSRNPKVVYMSPQGKVFNHETAAGFAREESIILICGRYKGIDQRIIDHYVDTEISMGDYVVSGGELPAMMFVDAVTRLIPGALGNQESAESDSLFNGLLEAPNYTRPEVFEDTAVPKVLLSGHHQKIQDWRMDKSIEKTRENRPDLYACWENKRRK